MKKYWIITEYYYPNENTTSYIMTKIAEGLSKSGDVNVITATSSKVEAILFERVNNVNINRVKDSRFDKNKLFQRTIKLILLGFRLIIKSSSLVKKDDIVLVVTNPATIVFLIRILRSFKKFKLFILVHDIFPENLVAAQIIKKTNLLYKVTLKLFNWAYLKSDELIVIGRDMVLFMRNKLGEKCPPIVYIPNFADVSEIKPKSKQQNIILQEYGLTDKFVILFTGNIGRAQDLPNILITMELLKENKDIHLLIIGNGAFENTIRQLIEEKSMKNITMLPSMSREFSNDFLNAGDIGLVSLQKGRKGIVSPSKTYSFLAAGKPILGVVDEGSEIFKMIDESKCGWWSEPANPIFLRDLIIRISKEKDELKERSIIARNLAVDMHSIEKIISQFQIELNII